MAIEAFCRPVDHATFFLCRVWGRPVCIRQSQGYESRRRGGRATTTTATPPPLKGGRGLKVGRSGHGMSIITETNSLFSRGIGYALERTWDLAKTTRTPWRKLYFLNVSFCRGRTLA